MQAKYFFTDCNNLAQPGSWKCYFHRKRSKCLVVNCTNQVNARHLCVRHGGRSKCLNENCSLSQRLGKYCARHTHLDLKKLCTEPGCDKQAHARRKCVRHGGGRFCNVPECMKHGRQRGFCYKHFRDKFGKIPAKSERCEVESIVLTNSSKVKMAIDSLLNDERLAPDIAWSEGLFADPGKIVFTTYSLTARNKYIHGISAVTR
ncbi:hypothetical protein AC1031_004071 [Aphanomyces cochlioides]|nr:hypothetical protein AC1031_004071 [Aphanomyces cochlioides]